MIHIQKRLQDQASFITVLYVEDDRAIGLAFYKILKSIFTNIDMVFDGHEGLQAFKEKKYDLIITDICMPNMNGIDMIKKIKTIHPKQTIIVTSAHNDAHYLQELINLNIASYIQKPVDLKLVLSTLEKILIVDASYDLTQIEVLEKQLIDTTKELERYVKTDLTTKLPNRSFFILEYNKLLKSLAKSTTKNVVLVLNIDDFKNIMNSYGSETGDKVLYTVAQRLSQTCSYMALVASLGVDSFVIALKDINDQQELKKTIEKILLTIKEPISLEDDTIYLGCNIGISFYGDDGYEAQTLLQNAQIAMFHTKQDKHIHYSYYNPSMYEAAKHEALLDSSIHKAIELDEFVVYYQPQVDSRSGKIIGAEALVRWEHPSLGLLAPYSFLPLAEKKGLLIEIDKKVIKEAFETARSWYDKGLDFGSISVNITADHLLANNFFENFYNLLKTTNCKPEWIFIEITEGAMMSNLNKAKIRLKKLKKLGVRIAIDDFGTGYSSLSYLKTFPIDKLKIDRAFIKDIPKNSEDISILNAIMSLAQSLKISTIAEGVETTEQKEHMLFIGNSEIQGYFYSPPVSKQNFESFLHKKVFLA